MDARHPELQSWIRSAEVEMESTKGLSKVFGRSVVFSAFYADLCLCLKSVIITTLNKCFYFYDVVKMRGFDVYNAK